jgi:hypothetical protein
VRCSCACVTRCALCFLCCRAVLCAARCALSGCAWRVAPFFARCYRGHRKARQPASWSLRAVAAAVRHSTTVRDARLGDTRGCLSMTHASVLHTASDVARRRAFAWFDGVRQQIPRAAQSLLCLRAPAKKDNTTEHAYGAYSSLQKEASDIAIRGARYCIRDTRKTKRCPAAAKIH